MTAMKKRFSLKPLYLWIAFLLVIMAAGAYAGIQVLM